MSSISGISSGTNLYQSQFKQVAQDFSSLQSDLSSGNLSTAQQAYTSLTKDLASVRQTEGIQTGGTSQINTDLAAVGSALQSGDLSGAQSAFTTLTQDLQGTQQSQGTQQTYGHHHHHGSSQAADASSQTSNTSSQASGTSSQTGSTNSQNADTSSQAGSTGLSTDLAAVGSALQSGDLSGAQSAFTTLTQDLQGTQQSQGTQRTYGHHHHHHHGSSQATDSSQTSNTSSQASGTSSQTGSTSLSTDLAAVGSALQSGDLSGAQNAFSKLMQDLGTGKAQNTTGTSGNGSTTLSISFTSINITV